MNIRLWAGLGVLLIWTGCQESPTERIKLASTLVFEDHFEGTDLDTAKWYSYSSNPQPFDRILPRGNCDFENAAVLLDRNIELHDGVVHLIARHEPARYTGLVAGEAQQDQGCGLIGQDSFLFEQQYTSATLRSRKGYNHGYFECRAKIPGATGLYPVLWLWHHDEIVVFEFFGDSKAHFASAHNKANYKSEEFHEVADYSDDFHVYAVDWGPDQITWYFDDRAIWTVNREDAMQEGAGHNYFPDSTNRWLSPNISLRVYEWAERVDNQNLPDTLQIDYFEVYQKT